MKSPTKTFVALAVAAVSAIVSLSCSGARGGGGAEADGDLLTTHTWKITSIDDDRHVGETPAMVGGQITFRTDGTVAQDGGVTWEREGAAITLHLPPDDGTTRRSPTFEITKLTSTEMEWVGTIEKTVRIVVVGENGEQTPGPTETRRHRQTWTFEAAGDAAATIDSLEALRRLKERVENHTPRSPEEKARIRSLIENSEK